MKTHFFDGEMNDENVVKLFAFLDSCNDEHSIIYLESLGGRVSCGQMAANRVNKHGQTVFLIAASDVGSSAFDFFFLATKARREILDSANFCYHLYERKIAFKAKGEPSTASDRDYKEDLKRSLDWQMNFVHSLGFTETEKEILLEGRDIWFSAERAREMLAFQENPII